MIKNIILDFGDIFINLDKSATPNALRKFGYKTLTSQLEILFNDYEKGLMTSSKFLDAISFHFPSASKQDLMSAWNCILLDFPDRRLEFLETLAKENRFRLFLLSNTNAIHIEHVKQKMGMEKFDRFKNPFEVFYLSYEMGMRKPDSEIFEFVLSENKLDPSETLFVDDTKENTDSAAAMGIKVWNLQVGKEDITQLKSHL
ncbi:MAG: HAD family phosphatase [Flavobacteriaceae bacterium]